MKIKIYKEDSYAAIKNDPTNIRYFENPSEKMQLFVIKTFGGSYIRYINPAAITENVKIAAIKNYPGAIRYIENPSEKVQLKSFFANQESIKYIKNPSEKLIREVITTCCERKEIVALLNIDFALLPDDLKLLLEI